MIVAEVRASYKYEKNFSYAWNLSDKSSTIEAKAKYISEFVSNIEEHKDQFAENDAVFFTTPDNSFEKNLDAVKTLKERLEDIKKMDPTSFQYNTAIEQITKQEQGEAGKLLDVIEGCYFLKSYPILWGWYEGIIILFSIMLLIIGIIGIIS